MVKTKEESRRTALLSDILDDQGINMIGLERLLQLGLVLCSWTCLDWTCRQGCRIEAFQCSKEYFSIGIGLGHIYQLRRWQEHLRLCHGQKQQDCEDLSRCVYIYTHTHVYIYIACTYVYQYFSPRSFRMLIPRPVGYAEEREGRFRDLLLAGRFLALSVLHGGRPLPLPLSPSLGRETWP